MASQHSTVASGRLTIGHAQAVGSLVLRLGGLQHDRGWTQ